MTAAAVAEKLGLCVETVKSEIKKLRDSGIIPQKHKTWKGKKKMKEIKETKDTKIKEKPENAPEKESDGMELTLDDYKRVMISDQKEILRLRRMIAVAEATLQAAIATANGISELARLKNEPDNKSQLI